MRIMCVLLLYRKMPFSIELPIDLCNQNALSIVHANSCLNTTDVHGVKTQGVILFVSYGNHAEAPNKTMTAVWIMQFIQYRS